MSEWNKLKEIYNYEKLIDYVSLADLNMTVGDLKKIFAEGDRMARELSHAHLLNVQLAEQSSNQHRKLEAIHIWFMDNVEYERSEHPEYLKAYPDKLIKLGKLLEILGDE